MKLMKIHPSAYSLILAAALSAGTISSAHAEAPMVTDDAGTLDKGGKKIEGGFTKIDKERVVSLGFGISPIENVELGATIAHLRDNSIPASGNTTVLSAKWIPYKNGSLSAGLKLEWARASSQGVSDTATTLTGLTTWRIEKGPVLHANLGRTSSANADSTNWALGFELPVAEKVQLTAEAYGSTGNSPGKQIGARWEVQQGLKVSAAVGRNSGQNTFSTGFSWEF